MHVATMRSRSATFGAVGAHRASLASIILGALSAAFAAFASPASALEREHHVGLDAGLSMLKIDDKSSLSACCGIGGHYVYGLTDAFNFMAEGTFSAVAFKEQLADEKTPHTRPTTVSHVAAGIAYVLDVLTYVPYAGLLVGGYALGGGTLDSTLYLPGAEIALGLDYKLTRKWTVGLAVRQTIFLAKTSTYPSYTNVFARFEYVWGW